MHFLKKILVVNVTLFVFAALTFFLLNHFLYLNKPLNVNLQSSVTIESDNGSGSGVVFLNKNKAFVWTCAHVVSGEVIPQVQFDYKNRSITTNVEVGWLKIKAKLFNDVLDECGFVSIWAKPIRYSEKDDLALLELSDYRIWKNSVEFPQNHKYIPVLGSRIFHIGSMKGFRGFGGTSDGIYGIPGIGLDKDGVIYDKISLNFNFGSSGGGVFESSDAKCIGLIARTHDQTMHQGYIVPVRRMWNFAERLDCTWALDNSITIPSNYHDKFSDDKLEFNIEWLKSQIDKMNRVDKGVCPAPRPDSNVNDDDGP